MTSEAENTRALDYETILSNSSYRGYTACIGIARRHANESLKAFGSYPRPMVGEEVPNHSLQLLRADYDSSARKDK